MKRTGFKQSAKPFKAKMRNPIKAKSAKRAAQHASQQGKDDLAHMGRVRDCPCIICLTHGETQNTPTEAHHVIMGRFGSLKTPAADCIALCIDHHRGAKDKSKPAIHRSPKAWFEKYGLDTDYSQHQRDYLQRYAD